MASPVLLCIDDRPQMLQVRKVRLETLGYSAETATSASTAIAMLEKMTIAAVFVEYKSEGMDAEAVAFQIKQRFPNQPIVLLSAYSDMPERILWLVDEYIMRGEPLERLAEVVERVTHPIPKIAPRSKRLQKRREAAA
jgi:CheY-like chemotaxis protein